MISHGRWTVEPVYWDEARLKGMWMLLQRFPTLFSDLTRGDFDNFVASVTAEGTLMLEVREGHVPVGYIKVQDLQQEIDCNAHVVFFDRKPAEKAQLCKLVTKWLFDNFPLRRITAEVPDIYTHTIRLAEKIGFRREGMRRKAVCIGGQWRNVMLFGLLREESYGRS